MYVLDKISSFGEQRGRCHGKIHVLNGKIIKETFRPPNSSASNIAIRKAIKRWTEATLEGTVNVINACLEDIPTAVNASLSFLPILKKVVRRKRREVGAVPIDPNSLEKLIITNDYTIYRPQSGR